MAYRLDIAKAVKHDPRSLRSQCPQMPLRQEAQFLRDRARRLREMAAIQTPLSTQLSVMAHELEARADELERDPGKERPRGA